MLTDLPISPPHGVTDISNRPHAFAYFVIPFTIVLGGAGIFNLLAIAYAFLPRLRDRLTQGSRALPWKPWVFGEGDFRPLYRLLMPCIITSMRSNTPYGISSTHILRSPTTYSYTE